MPLPSYTIPSPSIRNDVALMLPGRGAEAVGPISAAAGEHTHAVMILAHHETVAVVLNFEYPIRPRGRRLRDDRDAELDEAGSGAYAGTRSPSHTAHIGGGSP